MAQARDEAGNIWEVDAQGNPVRLIRAAGAAPQMPADPTFPYQGAKAAVDVMNTKSTIADRTADNARADRQEARESDKARRDRLEWEAKFNPDGSPKGKPDTVQSAVDSIAELDRLIAKIDSIKTDASDNGGWGETGFTGARLRNIGGTAAFGLAADLKTLDASAAFKALQKMRDESPTGGALGQITEKELELLKSTVANLDPDQAQGDFLARLDDARAYYEQMRGRIAREVPPERLQAAGGAEKDRRTPPVMEQPGFAPGGAAEKSIPIPQPMQDEHAAYLAQNWGRLDPSAYAEFRASLDGKYGFEPRPDAYRAIVPGLNDRAAQGGSSDGLNIPPVNAKMDGLDQINASVFNNKAGGFIFGAGDQLGVADELAGGFNSLVKGTDYDVEVARANAMKQGMQDAYPGMNLTGNIVGALATGAGAAKAFPGLSSALTGSTKRTIGTGAAFGGASGAGEMNDSRMTGLAIGTGLGVAGGGAGAMASPIIRSAMGTQAGQAVSRAGRSAWNNTAGKITPSMQVAAAPVVPQFRKGEGLLPAEVLESAIPNLQDADRLGLPYALADADPQLRALAGSVSRRSADARQMAENIFEPRARGQADRLVSAVDQRLAPVTDINARSADIMKGANIEAGPYYSRAKAQPALDDPVVGSILNTKTGKDALKRAYGLASDERRDPSQLGFIYDEATGGVRINDAPGRYTTERGPQPPHERAVIAGRGRRAPADLVTFVRQSGGLRNQGGELSHMGATNDARKGVPFAGQDTKWGPLVSENGRNLDEMAEAAWEAGYFAERPTTADFLDSLRGTLEGERRIFHPDDQGVVGDYFNAQANRYQWINNEGRVADTSQPAGPDMPFAPPEAYGKEVALPTYETLHYVRQGFDDILDGYRDKVTGKVNLDNEGRAISNLRRDLSERLQQNTDFRQGDEIYSKGAKRRDALRDGFEVLPRNNVPFRDFEQRLSGARAYDDNFTQEADRLVPEMQRGFATNMADTADKMRLSGNPWEAVYGAPNQQQKIGALFPDGAGDFGRQYGLERDMSKTAYETMGGSPTAMRQATDQQFDSGMMGIGTDLAVDTIGGGGGAFTLKSMIGRGARALGDTARIRGGKAKADAIAPVLYAPDPRMTLDYLADLQARQAQAASRAGAYRRRGGLFGAILPSAFLGSE